MTTWRYLTHDSVGAGEGLALDEALAAGHRRDTDEPTALRLYTYASHAALCGRYQHIEAEIALEACRRTGTAFNRRPTGGGAIVMGEGQLGVAVATPAAVVERPKQMLLKFSEGIVAGLERLGIQASFGGKNDLNVDGKKIAGLGLYLDGEGGMLFHSSILADLDIGFMLEVLDIPAAKLGGKAVGAVERRITTVSKQTGREWTGRGLREVIADGFADAMGVELAPSEATPAEAASADHLLETKYATEEWVHQRGPHADATGTSVIKAPGGFVRVYVAMSGDLVKSALFTGDFNQLPDSLAEFESRLKWSRLEQGALERLAAETIPDGSVLGVGTRELVDVVLDAGRRARVVEAAAPDRTGSCYFPEHEGVRA